MVAVVAVLIAVIASGDSLDKINTQYYWDRYQESTDKTNSFVH